MPQQPQTITITIGNAPGAWNRIQRLLRELEIDHKGEIKSEVK